MACFNRDARIADSASMTRDRRSSRDASLVCDAEYAFRVVSATTSAEAGSPVSSDISPTHSPAPMRPNSRRSPFGPCAMTEATPSPMMQKGGSRAPCWTKCSPGAYSSTSMRESSSRQSSGVSNCSRPVIPLGDAAMPAMTVPVPCVLLARA